jgi:WXG100 family type VII secretion target
MAQIVVDSSVMRDKAKTLSGASSKIKTLYDDMLNEVDKTASSMKGTTIETQQKQFKSMQSKFHTISADIQKYSDFLAQAADSYEAAENEGTQKAQQQGKIF